MSEQISWGILGAGRIAPRFAASAQQHPDCRLYAIASRTPEKAQKMANDLKAEKWYGSYEDLLADPKVDAVYIALPHKLHAPWALKALEAGKAVLCEKPAVLNETEMMMVLSKAQQNNLLFMEAMKTRFVPAYRRIFDLVYAEDAIGPITSMSVSLCNDFKDELEDQNAYWNQPDQGGALLDGGCYAATWLADYLPFEFSVDTIRTRMHGQVDRFIEAEMNFSGIPAHFETAIDESREKIVQIIGERGEITADNLHRVQEFVLHNENGTETFRIPYDHDDFYSQIDSFVKTLQAGEADNEIMPMAASLQQTRILDALKKKALEQKN